MPLDLFMIGAAVALAAWQRPAAAAGDAPAGDGGEAPAGTRAGVLPDETGLPPVIEPNDADANLAAFLMTIRTAEGTADPNGYRALFGHRANRPRLFSNDFSDHPRIATAFKDKDGRMLWTSAAGAYQFMAVSPIPTGGTTRVDTWDRIARRLQLPDFSPDSQDAAAVELIREKGALADVRAGRFEQAIDKVRTVWASLPGAGYKQPERSVEALRLAYLQAGGTLA